MTTETKLLREHLDSIREWIRHWDTDRLCGLPCTEGSLILADGRIAEALVVLNRIEQKEAA